MNVRDDPDFHKKMQIDNTIKISTYSYSLVILLEPISYLNIPFRDKATFQYSTHNHFHNFKIYMWHEEKESEHLTGKESPPDHKPFLSLPQLKPEEVEFCKEALDFNS